MENQQEKQLEFNLSSTTPQNQKEAKSNSHLPELPKPTSELETLNLPTAPKSSQLSRPLSSSRPFWSEVNGLVLPFFILDKHSTQLVIEYRYRGITTEGKELAEYMWRVSGNPDYGGLPSLFDWQTHRAIEGYISELPRPIQNPISFSIYDLIKRMGITKSGESYEMVKKALLKIAAAMFQSESAFYAKSKRRRITAGFHLYDQIILKDQDMPDGSIADKTYVWFNEWYLDSVNHHYVRPLDSEYYWSLGKPLSRRLYELLGPKFYGLLNIQNPVIPWRVDYFNLCQMLPIKPMKYLSRAKQTLDSAHKELVATGYLADVQWKIEGKGPYHWHLEYYMGERAIAEIQRASEKKYLPKLSKTELKIHKRSEGVPTKESKEYTPPKPEGLAKELTDRGVVLKTANKLVVEYPESKVKTVIEYVDWYQTQPKQKEVENLAAYIIRLIEDPEFAPSEDFYKHQQLQIQKQEEEALKQKAFQVQQKRVAKALRNWDSEDIIEKQIKGYRAAKFAINQRELSEEETEAKRKEFLSFLPQTEEERKAYLSERVYPLDSIISELRKTGDKRKK